MMGSLAFWVLAQMNHPPHIEHIPFKIMSFQPTEHHISAPLPQPLSPTQQHPVSKMIPTPIQTITKPLLSALPSPAAAPTAPVISPIPQVPVTKPLTPPQSVPIAAPKLEVKPDTATEKRHFLASLRSTIQNNLRYPPSARRRGIQGEIAVRFSLNESGSINSINILSGENIFHNAAKAAVASASGINVPKNLTDSLPMEIDLTLEFTLKSDG
jgi:TonB family protein